MTNNRSPLWAPVVCLTTQLKGSSLLEPSWTPLLKAVARNRVGTVVIVLLAVFGVAYTSILGMSPEEQKKLLWTVQDFLPIIMFLTLATLLFSGYPVAFILGGLALLFGLIGYFLGMFSLIEFFNFMPRIWFQGAENLVLVSVPAFVFMGVMMERSGVANDLLYCVQVLLKKVAGSLALAVTIMGTVLAAMTGIIGASVTMMTALALPTMLRQGYSHSLSCGTIAASGTLGILIPPSIMLIIMADLMAVSVGNVFMAAIVPGLCLAVLYLLYVSIYAKLKPEVAPSLPPDLLYVPRRAYPGLIFKSFLPPVFLITMIKGSILFGIATPSEAGAVGAFGVMLLALFSRRLTFGMLRGVCHTSARTVAMILLHHHQRHLFRLRLPVSRRRRYRRAPHHRSRVELLGAAISVDGDHVLPGLLPRLD